MPWLLALLVLFAPALASDAPEAADGASHMTTLHDAIESDDLAAVRELLAAGASPDTRNTHGIPALHHAARHGRLQALDLLLEAGADLESTDKYNRTAVTFAANLCADPGPTRLLLARGAKVPDIERAIGNAMSPATRQLLSEHFSVPIPEPPPPPTPPDPPTPDEWSVLRPKIDAAFAQLGERGVYAVPDAAFTQQLAIAVVRDALGELPRQQAQDLRGWCFTTSQDMARAVKRGQMPIGFGAAGGDGEAWVAVGQEIVDVFTSAGFDVEWGGTSSSRPTVLVRTAL